MQLQRSVNLPSARCEILISDEPMALLAAKAAKRAIIGYSPDGRYLPGADYVVEDLKSVDEGYLEKIARRHLGLPWNICESSRLKIRELDMGDAPFLEALFGVQETERKERLSAYIDCQYRFFEYGLWAVLGRDNGGCELVGWAGFSPLEIEGETVPVLGYYIREPFRNRGYAKEACRAALAYGQNHLGFERVVCRIVRSNQASLRVAQGLDVEMILLESEPKEDS